MVDSGKGMITPKSDDEAGEAHGPDLTPILNGKKLRRVYLTHNHLDHIGFVPGLNQVGLFSEETSIYGTPQTNALLDVLAWGDVRKGTLDFNLLDYLETIDKLKNLPKPGESRIGDDVIYTDPNGHQAGSTSFSFRTPVGRVAKVMGDGCWHDQAIVQGGSWPSELPKEWLPDEIWGTDLTYASGGMSEERSYYDKKQEFIEAIKGHLNKGKTVVIMGFATSKIPNAANDLIAAGIPCWVDSITAWKSIGIYHQMRWSDRDNVIPEPGEMVGIRKVDGRDHRNQLMEDGEPKVILATGGMGDFGPILDYYDYGLARENFVFIATSWLAPGSNGLKLVELVTKYPEWKGNENNRKVRLRFDKERKVLSVRADVQRFGLSSHGTFGDFIHYLTQLIDARDGKLLERIFLTHGTIDAMMRARKELEQFAKEVIPGSLVGEAEII